jgi:hypothetical protein
MAFGACTTPSMAQTSSTAPADEWQFAAAAYGYLPTISGSAHFPTGATPDITVDPSDILHNLNFAFMGALEARYGRYGAFTDILYVNAGDSKSATHALSIGGVSIPSNVTADAHLDVKSTIWTLGGSYRVADSPAVSLDLLVGARALFLKQHLSWQFSSDVGPFVGPARQGSGNSDITDWDGVIGAKGRWTFGEQRAWFVPYYLDLGTGQSEFTWQGITGLGYTFRWGEVFGVWRYIDYRFSSHSTSLTLSGPALGVAFHW